MHNEVLFSQEKEGNSAIVTTQINLEHNMLSEISQTNAV